jgi:hypothetical protein
MCHKQTNFRGPLSLTSDPNQIVWQFSWLGFNSPRGKEKKNFPRVSFVEALILWRIV